MKFGSQSLKNWVLASCAASVIAMAAPAVAQSNPTFEFDIESKELGAALTDYGITTGNQVLFNDRDVRGKMANEVEGVYSSNEAVELLLDDTGVKYRIDDNGTLLVGSEYVREANLIQTNLPESNQGSSLGEENTPAPFRVAQLDQEDDVRGVEAREEEDDESRQDVIVVTGTNIRGLAQESSPAFSYDREDILATGAGTAQDFINTLPQNFGGGSSDALSGVPGDINSLENGGRGGSFGSSVNLRGLGSGGTLVLLNGRRLAPSSAIGDFVDISLIPASAIERVDVLTDGASSIYGADAVAGVVNFVLRDDFEGVELSARYGAATEGSFDEARIGATGGIVWNSGNALISGEYYQQANLSAADRTFSETAPIPTDLLPSTERWSLLFSGTQRVSDSIELSSDVSYSIRETDRFSTLSGSAFEQFPTTESINGAVGVVWEATNSWVIDGSLTYSDVSNEIDAFAEVDTFRSLSFTDSDIFNAELKASGNVLSVPGGRVKAAVGMSFRVEDFSTIRDDESTVPDVIADREVVAVFGELFVPLVGSDNSFYGVRRLELNVSGRHEDFSDFGQTTNPKIGILYSPIEHLNFRSTYSESFQAPPLGRVGDTDRFASALSADLIGAIFGTPVPNGLEGAAIFNIGGTAENIAPETSRAFTIGMDYQKDWNDKDLSFSVTYFNYEFEDRLGSTLVPGGLSTFLAPFLAFEDPSSLPPGTVLFNPTTSQIEQILGGLRTVVGPSATDTPDAFNFAPILRNLASTNVEGIDLDLQYNFDLEGVQIKTGINASYFLDFVQQSSVASPEVNVLNTLYNPVDLNVRANVGFNTNNFSGNAFLNYTNDYAVSREVGADEIDSWITLDLNLAYAVSASTGPLKGTALRLNVRNVFDEQPPAAPGDPRFGIFNYDPTNASPIGRFMSLELTKRF